MNKFFSQKQFLIILSLSLFLILFFPSSAVQSQSTIIKALAFIPNAIFTIFLQITLLLIRGIFEIANWLLGWAMGNPFGVSLTNPGGINFNPVIRVGWTLLRDITNMFFILGLAYVGLATSLNMAGFDTKKMFGNILIVALLINFTPVICGVVVDISNLISKFFLADADFTKLVSIYNTLQGGFANIVNDIFNFVALSKTILLITYGLIGSIIFLLFAALFLLRGPIIWILVILSPLAFFSWIFPKTKGMIWNKWWDTFLQWSIIVIPASFFLYLSQQVIAEKDSLLNTAGLADPTGTFLIELAPYFVSLMFMIFGLIITLQINAMGVKGLVAGVKRGSKAAGKVMGKKMWTGTKVAAGAAVGAVAGAVAGSHMRATYKAGRLMGLPRYKAAGEAMKRQWTRRVKPTIVKTVTTKAGAKKALFATLKSPWTATKALGRATWGTTKMAATATTKGTWSAVKDSATAGWKAGWKVKAKKKGEQCPQCKTVLAHDTNYCPSCGLKF